MCSAHSKHSVDDFPSLGVWYRASWVNRAGAELRPLLKACPGKEFRAIKTSSAQSCHYSFQGGENDTGSRLGREIFVEILINKQSLPNNLAKYHLRREIPPLSSDVEVLGGGEGGLAACVQGTAMLWAQRQLWASPASP